MSHPEKVRRTLTRHGEAVTITTYTQTGTDDYGDPEFSSSDTSDYGIVVLPGNDVEAIRDAAGETQDFDAVIFVANDLTVEDASDSTPKPSKITRDKTGRSFRVESTFVENNGLLRVDCARKND